MSKISGVILFLFFHLTIVTADWKLLDDFNSSPLNSAFWKRDSVTPANNLNFVDSDYLLFTLGSGTRESEIDSQTDLEGIRIVFQIQSNSANGSSVELEGYDFEDNHAYVFLEYEREATVDSLKITVYDGTSGNSTELPIKSYPHGSLRFEDGQEEYFKDIGIKVKSGVIQVFENGSSIFTHDTEIRLLTISEWDISFENTYGDSSQMLLDKVYEYQTATQSEDTSLIPRYRLYNPSTGRHFWTTSAGEYDYLGSIGWTKENANYQLSNSSITIQNETATPYFRLYNPSTGRHFWTSSEGEYNYLGSIGWSMEGTSGYLFLNQVNDTIPLYRLYNSFTGDHFWTSNEGEYNYLGSIGWNLEGVAGYVFPVN